MSEVVAEINQVTRGWGQYFALAHYQRSFQQMNHFIAHRLRQWLWHKHGNPAGKYKRWPNRVLTENCGPLQTPNRPGMSAGLLEKWNSESRMRENRPSGLMRGGKQMVMGSGLSTHRFPPTLRIRPIYDSLYFPTGPIGAAHELIRRLRTLENFNPAASQSSVCFGKRSATLPRSTASVKGPA